jgi:hypothetical protein
MRSGFGPVPAVFIACLRRGQSVLKPTTERWSACQRWFYRGLREGFQPTEAFVAPALRSVPTPAGLYRRPTRRPAAAGPFDDILSFSQRAHAEKIYAELREPHFDRLNVLPVATTRAGWTGTVAGYRSQHARITATQGDGLA